jgi:hypothetical protein
MVYQEGEDEFDTNELHWWAAWGCDACGLYIRDFEDGFILPDDLGTASVTQCHDLAFLALMGRL